MFICKLDVLITNIIVSVTLLYRYIAYYSTNLLIELHVTLEIYMIFQDVQFTARYI